MQKKVIMFRGRRLGPREDLPEVQVDVVLEGGRVEDLDPRLDLVNHSPTGFEWGYRGSGPAQLALALLARYTGRDDVALALYQGLKEYFVAGWADEWTLLAEQLDAWLDANAREFVPECEE